MIFDTHAHYDDKAFDQDRSALLEQLEECGIGMVVNVGASITTSQNTLALIQKYSWMYGAIGVHPSESQELSEAWMGWLKKQAGNSKVKAIGEIGLDYYWEEPEQQIQKHWFRRQLELAKEVKLPVIIHSRDAAKDTAEILKQEHAEQIGGVIHCFSYGVEMASRFLDLGFYLGIGGVVTFQNAKRLKEVVSYMPVDRLVLETDCPYLAPVPHRGKRNSSLNLPFIIDEIARLKKMDRQEVIQISTQNARTLYGIE